MSLSLNDARLSAVKPSATLEMSRKAKAMIAEGVDVKLLSAGEPDFNTPACIIDHAYQALKDGATRYTPARGTPDLIAAIREKFERDQGHRFAADEVMGTVGTKGGISLALDAIVEPGDEVILFPPCWVSYYDLVRLAGGTPVEVRTTAAEGFVPSAAALKAAITPRTKAILLNTPGNPTGAGLSADALRALMGVLEGTDIWVLSDEIYERLTYDGFQHVSPISLSDDAASRTVVLTGVAKAYAMTGWRLGCVGGPAKLIGAMGVLQQQRLSHPTSVAQAAAAYALREPPEVVEAVDAMAAAFTERRKLVLELVKAIPGAKVHPPQGAFYVYLDLPGRLPGVHSGKPVANDVEMATRLLEEAHVATVPGTPFGSPGGLRLSFAADQATLREGIARIGEWLEGLQRAG